ncbi:MAG: hypothetical protein ACQCN6_06930 [Candidatus Bathyarchaeia archaeon]
MAETVEASGIIITTRIKIESELKKNKAFDEKSASTFEDFGAVLDIMERSGLIAKTADGKYFMTKKGQEQQIRGFSIKAPPYRIKRFSRNK